jgi:8-oxo-dGTP pyrophosphatase MutT (NUDIX family)
MPSMAAPKRAARDEHSSGGIVVREDGSRLLVALIATRGRTRWGLPKGAIAAGETTGQAAVREVQEETGLSGEILGPIDTIQYFFRAGDALVHKTVDFYLMRYIGGKLTPQLSEVDDAEWVELSEAIKRSSFDSERKLLQRVQEEYERMVAASVSGPTC